MCHEANCLDLSCISGTMRKLADTWTKCSLNLSPSRRHRESAFVRANKMYCSSTLAAAIQVPCGITGNSVLETGHRFVRIQVNQSMILQKYVQTEAVISEGSNRMYKAKASIRTEYPFPNGLCVHECVVVCVLIYRGRLSALEPS